MKKTNRTAIILRLWLWAAMHSPHFNRFIFRLNRTRFNVVIRLSEQTQELLVIRLSFIFPTGLAIDAPHAAVQGFIDYMKTRGIEVHHSIIDGIPF